MSSIDMPARHSTHTEFDIAKRVILGKNIFFGDNCKKIKIGFGTFLGDNLYIDLPELEIGNYCRIHNNGVIHGYQPCKIGHNCWIGQNTIIDSIGGTTIGNNVGIGAFSQLWSHIKFGDMLDGCRWNIHSPLIVDDDVWFVGHCIVSPIHAKRRSMLLIGSVATKDMEENHVYAGSPAKDITDKIGPQFSPVAYEQKIKKFNELYQEFLKTNHLTIDDFRATVVDDLNGKESTESETFFNLFDRTYQPSYSELEYLFFKFILYDRAKFIPIV